MRYLPLTQEEREEMLQSLGIEKIEDLFTAIPEEMRLDSDVISLRP